jgi:hypothetical protein
MKLIERIEYYRLSDPKNFPYEHQNRLCRTVTDKILQSLLDFHYAFRFLPESYKKEIIQSPEFSSFMSNIFSVGQVEIEKLDKETEYPPSQNEKTVDEKVVNEKTTNNTITTNLYQKFFNIGLDGLIKTLPQDFIPHLQNEIKPLLMLMIAISKNTKSKYPVQLEFPTWVYDNRTSVLANF